MKVAAGKGNEELLETIRQSIVPIPGVREVAVNPTTGSVVVHYDEEHHPTMHAKVEHHSKKHLKVCRAPEVSEVDKVAEGIEREAEFLAEHSHVARAVVDFCRTVDDGVKRVTNNAVDLKVVLPLGLAVVTFLEIGATAATPVWLTLGLFSLNHFVELHAHDGEDDDEDEDCEEGEA